jgi:hypothetical protein
VGSGQAIVHSLRDLCAPGVLEGVQANEEHTFMRRTLALNLACAAALAAVPATAAAHSDHAEDGSHNREAVGSVTSLTGDVLTITLADGSTMTGKVTARTDVECKGDNGVRTRGRHHAKQARTARHGDDDRGGDDRRGGDDNRGDDDRGDDDRRDRRVQRTDCGTAALIAGAKVHDAELGATSTGAVFEEVELLR